jgi:predicted site-specific integrase-resolvase
VSTPLRALPAGKALLGSAEVAAALGIRTRTALVWLQRGRFPGAFRTPGGSWRVPASSVVAVRVELGITDEGG